MFLADYAEGADFFRRGTLSSVNLGEIFRAETQSSQRMRNADPRMSVKSASDFLYAKIAEPLNYLQAG